MFVVEWIFVSLFMVSRAVQIERTGTFPADAFACFRQAILGLILFHMSNWAYPWRYIGYMIPEAFTCTAINMVCAYIAASIPYANATFTVNFYFCLMIGGF
jgi:hypothetical protein